VNPFAAIAGLFEPKDNGPTEEGKRWAKGCRAFEKGKQHYLTEDGKGFSNDQIQLALDAFDEAIEAGFEGGRIYASRGSCLQSLEYHLDAIEDFTKAIQLTPEDSNLYFMRSVSKGASGDLTGRVADLVEAIRVSAIENEANKIYHGWARTLGYKNITAKYEFDLLHAKVAIEEQAEEQKSEKISGVDLNPELAKSRMAWTRRRMRTA
jgi:tetratricopeptide (TPR) repeat protein